MPLWRPGCSLVLPIRYHVGLLTRLSGRSVTMCTFLQGSIPGQLPTILEAGSRGSFKINNNNNSLNPTHIYIYGVLTRERQTDGFRMDLSFRPFRGRYHSCSVFAVGISHPSHTSRSSCSTGIWRAKVPPLPVVTPGHLDTPGHQILFPLSSGELAGHPS